MPRRWRAHTTSHAIDAPRAIITQSPHPQLSRSLTQSCAAESRKIKLLILGAGESGKSTLFKQMKILYGTPFTSEEAIYIKAVIHENVLEAMQTLITNLENFDETRGLEVGCQDALELVRAAEVDEPIDEELGNALQALWKDPAIQAMWKLRGRVQLVESVVYFFNKLDEIGKDDWVPSNQDILAARVRTHGIVTTKYTIEDRQYEMYDVGGQRNERRKWAHCFEGVTGIIFVASLSDYDQKMFEDETTNRMKDSVYLFRDICANPAFAETPIILFLNKRDLFQKKIRDVRIGGEGCFRDYDGPPNDYAAGVDYFLRYFLKQNRDPDRKVFHHVTCATDTANVQVVMDSTRAMIIQDSLNF